MRHPTLPLAMLLTLAAAGRGEASPTPVPLGEAPSIDGRIEPGEWKDATAVRLDPAGEAFLRRDEQALYVGLRVEGESVASLALLRGDRLLVLHASASLGTAEYVRSGTVWSATRNFAWRCRQGRSDPDCARFLAEEGWVATTVHDGRDGEIEFRIASSLLEGASTRIAIVACRIQPPSPTPCAWPLTVRDDIRSQDLLFGNTPDLRLDPETWAQLDLGPVRRPAERLKAALDAIEAERDPVAAYLGLLELLDENPEAAAGSERARRLRTNLEKEKAVGPEAKAHQQLQAALDQACRRLGEVEAKHPHTRAARIARERIRALRP